MPRITIGNVRKQRIKKQILNTIYFAIYFHLLPFPFSLYLHPPPPKVTQEKDPSA